MILALEALRQEFPPMLRLAGPVVLTELGWITMGIVDTIMVGRVSAEAIGGVSIGSILFYTVAIFGTGLLLGLDTLVSQAFGAKDVDDCHRSLLNGLYLILPLAPLLMGVLWLCKPLLPSFGIRPVVLREAIPYLNAITWSTFPQLLFFGLRRYLQAMNLVRPVLFSLITANLINLGGNWILIFGHLGAKAMGAEGAGWATSISRLYMALFLLAYTFYHDQRHGAGFRNLPLWPDFRRIRRLISLGFPAALQMTVEVGVFATATTLIGRLDKESLAANQIALNLATLTYMVPFGISSAAAVRVGQALGRGDPAGAGRSGWTALLLGSGFMLLAAISFVLVPRWILRIFTTDRAVITAGVSLLFVAAFFQLFDGIQTVATGALRGAGDTRTPMLSHLVCYWMIGLPAGYFLCFSMGWGAPGLWIGLCIALILIGLILLLVWHWKVRSKLY